MWVCGHVEAEAAGHLSRHHHTFILARFLVDIGSYESSLVFGEGGRVVREDRAK